VNARSKGEEAGAGNHIMMIAVNVPIDAEEPLEQLKVLQKKVAVSRNARSAELIAATALIVATIPTPLQMLGARC
jgi:hypothetical protein